MVSATDGSVCPKCKQPMPAGSLSLRCACGYDLRRGPAGLEGFLLRNWPWIIVVVVVGVVISINPERVIYAGIVGAVQGGILAGVLWGISKLIRKRDK